MSSFEYVSVLLSIVLALGVAHILRGITLVIEHWGRLDRYWIYLVWCTLILAMHVGYWQALWRFHDRPEWSGAALGYWFLSVATLFVASRLLVLKALPPLSMREHFTIVRRPFFGALTVFWLLATSGPLFLSSPWMTPHRPFVVIFALLCLSGAVVPSERYQVVLVLVWTFLYVVHWTLFQGPIA